MPKRLARAGMAIRFYLGEHVSHRYRRPLGRRIPSPHRRRNFSNLTAPSLPVRQQRRIRAPIEVFLGAHPAALRFVQLLKPIPTSFAPRVVSSPSRQCDSPMQMDSADSVGFRIRPAAGNEFLSNEDAAKQSANFPRRGVHRAAQSANRSLIESRYNWPAPGDEVNDAHGPTGPTRARRWISALSTLTETCE